MSRHCYSIEILFFMYYDDDRFILLARLGNEENNHPLGHFLVSPRRQSQAENILFTNIPSSSSSTSAQHHHRPRLDWSKALVRRPSVPPPVRDTLPALS